MMKKINVILDIDDLNPSVKWGLEKDEGEYKFINALQNEFKGLKITLFIPANFNNRADLRHNKEWVNWIKSKPNTEIACHGLTHSNQSDKKDAREFFNCSPWEVSYKLVEAKKIFEDVGIEVKGIKAGGWDVIPEFYQLAPHYFNYMADHFIGTKPLRVGDSNFFRVPYTYSVENIEPKIHETVILHGHITQKNGNRNGLNTPIYHCIRNYLKDLNAKFEVNYMTMGELVEKEFEGVKKDG